MVGCDVSAFFKGAFSVRRTVKPAVFNCDIIAGVKRAFFVKALMFNNFHIFSFLSGSRSLQKLFYKHRLVLLRILCLFHFFSEKFAHFVKGDNIKIIV